MDCVFQLGWEHDYTVFGYAVSIFSGDFEKKSVGCKVVLVEKCPVFWILIFFSALKKLLKYHCGVCSNWSCFVQDRPTSIYSTNFLCRLSTFVLSEP